MQMQRASAPAGDLFHGLFLLSDYSFSGFVFPGRGSCGSGFISGLRRFLAFLTDAEKRCFAGGNRGAQADVSG